MRRAVLVSGLALSVLLSACDRNPSEPVGSPAPATAAETPAPVEQSPVSAPAVAAWGPQTTEQGVAVNVQKGGHSGLWIKMTAPAFGTTTQVTFDGKPVDQIFVTSSGDVLTMMIPAEYISTPGMKAVALKIDENSPEMIVGNFEVTAVK